MTVRVLFFGATADETGKCSIELELGANTEAKQALDRVLTQFPQLKKHRLLFAVNQEYVSGDRQMNNGDELAIFTPVSGG